jgi:nucleotide-binding universal stress UspA family protein
VYKRIVVGTDGSPTATGAVTAAIALASELGAHLHVVCVHDAAHISTAVAAATAGLPSTYNEINDAARNHTDAVLSQAAARARAEGVDVTVHACAGSPAETLVTVAAGESADLIIVGNRGMHGLRRVLGSVPNHVAHHATCAVMIVPTT